VPEGSHADDVEPTRGHGESPSRVVGILGQFGRVGQAAAPLRTWSVPFLGIFGVAALVYLATFWTDQLLTASTPGEVTVGGLLQSLADQDIEQARNTLGGLGEVMAAVLGLALTVSSIIVQLAATRFTPHITSLFFRARTNLLVLAFFVTSSVYVLWVNFSVGESYLPKAGVLVSMLLMTASLLLLFPYFAYVFDFLDPEKIVGRIMNDGLAAATPTKGDERTDVRQAEAIEAIEHLANIGLNALQQKDKGIASGAIDSLCEFGIRYGESKAAMRKEWSEVQPWNRQSPDFVSLSDEAVADLVKRGTWVEWKLLRQYQMLFTESLGQIKDTCYLLAIDTRRLGEAAGRRGDLWALDLAIKFFNTYLRATINAKDIRTAYNILHQYRQLAETVLAGDPAASPELRRKLQHRALQVARFMRYYSSVSYARDMPFISEVIAHDIGTLCEQALALGIREHREFLQVFLAVDEHAETKEQEKTLRGVRRAQVKLATTYLMRGAEDYAREIQVDMGDEPPARLHSIWQELRSLDTREFWEVNDRGTNFDYLSPDQKEQLEEFFGWFDNLDVELEASRSRQTLSSLLPQ
jgi:hypothetical protein